MFFFNVNVILVLCQVHCVKCGGNLVRFLAFRSLYEFVCLLVLPEREKSRERERERERASEGGRERERESARAR
jgi:hypothetical protein